MSGTESTLFRRVLSLLLLSVYVPVILLGYFSYRESSARLDNATAAFLLDHLQNNARRLQELMEAVERHSVSLYASEKLQRLLANDLTGNVADFEFQNEAAKLRSELAGPYYFSVLGRNWERLEPYGLLWSDAPRGVRDWIERAEREAGEGFWMHEFQNEFGVEYADFYFVRSVRSLYPPDFRHLGVVTIRIPASLVRETLVQTERYPNYRLQLLDRDGRDLLQARGPSADDARPPARFTPPSAAGELVRLHTEDGEELYAASARIGAEEWRLAAMIPAAEVTGQVRQMNRYVWIAVLVSLAVITGLLAWIANSFTDPLRRIARHMKKLHRGQLEDYPYPGDSARTDEIGQLTRGYNSMIGGMRELLEGTKRSEEERRKLEIQMLLHQINPHFLYNTLDSIKWRADMAGQQGISEMVRSLADLLRFSLSDGSEMTTLERELDHVRAYIGIEQMRKGSFQVLVTVGAGLGPLPFLKLILQPLVENSIRYGIRPLPPGEGKLILSVYREADSGDIVCTIEDNGRGCDDESIARLNRIGREEETPRTIGLPNVCRRLRRAFGETYGVAFERTGGGGVRTILRHPALRPESDAGH
ncbi:sensor histidine kinase [Paenibacillus antri]|uniref:Sensor histidine kinase n=1 Tax=Paenibacillus antri TaxID=2582848 RepID=A0A5R9GJX3_9BACL|nr:sensor histidine kinase [Paenibacillus antri]TLS53824.1 sensor histidine kinase [Paenibacillus antri]